jgi:hypothetical protein
MLVQGNMNPLKDGAFPMAWRHLRSLRAKTPGAAGANPARRSMFTASLEQAEQLFAAAASAGVMTKPLQLYYGLSQAGRAIAAVAPNVPDQQQGKPAEPWKLSGHGIAIPTMQQAVAACGGSLGLLPVADKGLGAFTQMAGILGCGSLIDKKPDGSPAARVTVGQIWGTLPESVMFWLDGRVGFPMLEIQNGPFGTISGTGWESATLEPIPDSDKNAGIVGLKEFLGHYPDAGSWALPAEVLGTDPADTWSLGKIHPEFNVLTLLWPEVATPGKPRDVLIGVEARVGARYFNTAYLFPALGDNARPLHPLLAWWATLYALSMVARYEPVAWTEMTAINTSSEATSIEHLLDTALIRLPRLVLDVIDELT